MVEVHEAESDHPTNGFTRALAFTDLEREVDFVLVAMGER